MMHIAFCTDTNYVMPTGVAMISICENNQEEEITFHLVITDEGTSLDEVDKKVQPLLDIASKYGKQAQTYSLKKEQLSAFECRGAGYISTTAFARIFLPDLLSNDISKVLYLDCDLVCDGSIIDLWNTELQDDCPFGAVVDSYYAKVSCHKRAEIPQSAHYINSGVLLMNLDCWRKNKYVELSVKTAIEKNFPLLDQDMLNHLFYDKLMYLPVKYNVQSVFLLDGIDNCHILLDYYDEIKQACLNPAIVHYLSANKPWKGEYCPFRDKWEKYLSISKWKDIKYGPITTSFNRTNVGRSFNEIYWMDAGLFVELMGPFLRFFSAAVKLKNKKLFIRIIVKILHVSAILLEKIYHRKTKCR